MRINNVWAVVPAYNEQDNISAIASKTKKYVSQVVVVDDGSSDKTRQAAEKSGVIVLRHVVNLGKGATLKTGCDFAVRNGARYIVALDADAQHNPKDIPRFIEKIGDYDIVFGFRKEKDNMPSMLRFGNWFISGMVNILYRVNIKDTQCGFRAFSKNAYKKIRWKSAGYAMESEMIANAGKQRLKYVQIPIKTIYSDRYKGTTIIDGMKIVLNMIWWKLFNN